MSLLVAIGLLALSIGTPVFASTALRVQPTSYTADLKQGEKLKGFIDVSNPTNETLRLTTSVSAFRQVSDDGALSFYQSDEVQKGIIPDLSSFELKPLEAMRMYFLLDGTKLPKGDTFGAMFFTAQPAKGKSSITQQVRVGVLFSIVNVEPGLRMADISSLYAPAVQFGKAVTGNFSIRNTAPAEQATGYYPKVQVSVSPFGTSKTIDAPLVFAGRTRTVSFTLPTDRFGLYQLRVQSGSSEKTQWIFAMTGWGRFVPSIVIIGLAAVLIFRRLRTTKN
jgi:hypothetical protein